MASKHSAGILLFRRQAEQTEVLLVHPGGPFWIKKDLGAWFIPKGELEPGEEPLAAAQREFFEELGISSWAWGFVAWSRTASPSSGKSEFGCVLFTLLFFRSPASRPHRWVPTARYP